MDRHIQLASDFLAPIEPFTQFLGIGKARVTNGRDLRPSSPPCNADTY